MYIGSRIFFIFENAQAIRGMDLLMLLVCGLWIIYKYNKPEYGFWMIISCLLSVHLGFIDALVFPFLIIAFYFLQKERYCLFAVFFTLCCCVKMQPLIIAQSLYAILLLYRSRNRISLLQSNGFCRWEYALFLP